VAFSVVGAVSCLHLWCGWMPGVCLQHTLIILRQRALKEKAAADLLWIDQQKQQLKNKGADDQHPDLLRQKRMILRKHKEEQVSSRSECL